VCSRRTIAFGIANRAAGNRDGNVRSGVWGARDGSGCQGQRPVCTISFPMRGYSGVAGCCWMTHGWSTPDRTAGHGHFCDSLLGVLWRSMKAVHCSSAVTSRCRSTRALGGCRQGLKPHSQSMHRRKARQAGCGTRKERPAMASATLMCQSGLCRPPRAAGEGNWAAKCLSVGHLVRVCSSTRSGGVSFGQTDRGGPPKQA
jgi:hypothetical protein